MDADSWTRWRPHVVRLSEEDARRRREGLLRAPRFRVRGVQSGGPRQGSPLAKQPAARPEARRGHRQNHQQSVRRLVRGGGAFHEALRAPLPDGGWRSPRRARDAPSGDWAVERLDSARRRPDAGAETRVEPSASCGRDAGQLRAAGKGPARVPHHRRPAPRTRTLVEGARQERRSSLREPASVRRFHRHESLAGGVGRRRRRRRRRGLSGCSPSGLEWLLALWDERAFSIMA